MNVCICSAVRNGLFILLFKIFILLFKMSNWQRTSKSDFSSVNLVTWFCNSSTSVNNFFSNSVVGCFAVSDCSHFAVVANVRLFIVDNLQFELENDINLHENFKNEIPVSRHSQLLSQLIVKNRHISEVKHSAQKTWFYCIAIAS